MYGKNIFRILLFLTFLSVIINSCMPPPQKYRVGEQGTEETTSTSEVQVSKSAVIPKDGTTPVAGVESAETADKVITFTSIGEKFEVKKGETVNFVYDGIDPERTFIIYESTYDGFNLQLAKRDEPIVITFNSMCQTYIVASPTLTTIEIPKNLKYEQIVWTPRADGTWEVRIGAVERGCKSKALDELQKLRSKQYEKSVPKK